MQQQHDDRARGADQDRFKSFNPQDGFRPSFLAYRLMGVKPTFDLIYCGHY
jgi:hypothetical protein